MRAQVLCYQYYKLPLEEVPLFAILTRNTSSNFFTAEQIVSLVTNVVTQIAQPQLCTKNLPEKQVQAKSDLTKQIAETAKKCLGGQYPVQGRV